MKNIMYNFLLLVIGSDSKHPVLACLPATAASVEPLQLKGDLKKVLTTL
jgi:hypothetical protein